MNNPMTKQYRRIIPRLLLPPENRHASDLRPRTISPKSHIQNHQRSPSKSRQEIPRSESYSRTGNSIIPPLRTSPSDSTRLSLAHNEGFERRDVSFSIVVPRIIFRRGGSLLCTTNPSLSRGASNKMHFFKEPTNVSQRFSRVADECG